MIDRKQALTDLLAKVEAGKYADQAMRVRAGLKDNSVAAFTLAFEGSLDAAKALHEAVLPNTAPVLDIVSGSVDMHDQIMNDDGTGTDEWEWMFTVDFLAPSAPIPARAWLIAILKALIAEEKTDE